MYRYEKDEWSSFAQLYENNTFKGEIVSKDHTLIKKIVTALNEYDQPKDCDHCGIPIKREDVVTGAYGGTFCCDEHRQAYDKE